MRKSGRIRGMIPDNLMVRLTDWFENNVRGGAVVAFSGGLDSTLVAAVAAKVLGKGAIAVTVRTDFVTAKDVEKASKEAKCIGINHEVLKVNLPTALKANPPDRCYKCKKLILIRLKEFARQRGFRTVVDGTNFDDLGTDRPGLRALEEERVRSPLAELGIGKAKIRMLSRDLGLDYTKSPNPCMATRFPLMHRITTRDIRRVDAAENFIRGLGFRQVRVRVFGDQAKIEVDPSDIPAILNGDVHLRIVRRLKDLGFKVVSLDLEGYREGKMSTTAMRS